MNLIQELKRRNVFRVGVAYVVTAWLILQVADIVFDNVPAPDWVMQSIMVSLLIGLPVVLVFAWAFEMTPEGIKKERDVDRTQSITHTTGRKLDRIIIAILVLAVVLLLVDRTFFNRAAPAQQAVSAADTAGETVDETPSVAVLPFINLSANKENEYFSDGLTETLLHMLAQLPDLRVAARTSAFAFKGQNKDVREVASELGVAHILEGSVQRAGDKVRVTAQLIRAIDGFHVWSQNYDRTLDDIFAIQDEIAGDVAGALGASLLPGQAGGMQGVATANTDAYDNYLRALEKNAEFSYSALTEAEGLLKNALAVDPDFFDAKVALARNYMLQNQTGLIDDDTANSRVEALVRQLLQVRPDSPASRGLDLQLQVSNAFRNGDVNKVMALLPQMVALVEEAPVELNLRHAAANIMANFNREEEALQLLLEGLMVDPLAAQLHSSVGDVHMQLNQVDEAEKAYLRAQELNPTDPNIAGDLAQVARDRGEVTKMMNWLRRSAELDPQDHEIPAIIANILYRFNFLESGDYWASRTRALSADSPAARGLDLNRAIAVDDPELIKAVALDILKDGVQNRIGVVDKSLQQYTRIMQNQGQSPQALQALEAIYPGISSYASSADDIEVLQTKFNSMHLFKELDSETVYRARYDALVKTADENGFPWRELPAPLMYMSVYAGDYETAIRAALELLEGANGLYTSWKNFEENPLLHPLLDDQQIAQRVNQFKTEEAQFRAELETMLQQPEWAL